MAKVNVERRRDRPRSPARRVGRSPDDDAAQRARAHRRPLRPPDDVRRRRHGQRHHHRTPGLTRRRDGAGAARPAAIAGRVARSLTRVFDVLYVLGAVVIALADLPDRRGDGAQLRPRRAAAGARGRELEDVDYRYQCIVCGAQAVLYAAPEGEVPEAPRHCREPMAARSRRSSERWPLSTGCGQVCGNLHVCDSAIPTVSRGVHRRSSAIVVARMKPADDQDQAEHAGTGSTCRPGAAPGSWRRSRRGP